MGRIYLLDTINGVMVKRVTCSEDRSVIICSSTNPDPSYSPFEVSLVDVRSFYRILLCMAIK